MQLSNRIITNGRGKTISIELLIKTERILKLKPFSSWKSGNRSRVVEESGIDAHPRGEKGVVGRELGGGGDRGGHGIREGDVGEQSGEGIAGESCAVERVVGGGGEEEVFVREFEEIVDDEHVLRGGHAVHVHANAASLCTTTLPPLRTHSRK